MPLSSVRDLEVVHLDPAKVRPNPWNPNRMNAFMYGKAMESVQRYGFIVPIIVREVGYDSYQIIDGEHRFRVAMDMEMPLVPAINLGLIDDQEAKKLTITLNELHGQALPESMGDLLKDLMKVQPLDDLLEELPYTEDMFRGLTELPPLPDLPEQKPEEKPEDEKRWVERLYRLPLAAAKVVDDALARAKAGDDIEDWQALERLAADYLAGD